MNLVDSTIEIFIALRKRGIGFLLDYLYNNVLFDLKRNTNTFLKKKEVDTENENASHGIYYVGSRTSTFNEIFEFLNDVTNDGLEQYQFVDLGCGKGKTLIMFLEKKKFKSKHKAIGIDYDNYLLSIANKNLTKLKMNKLSSLINDDAIFFTKYIQSKNIILYLYNPFDWYILEKVLAETVKKLEKVFIVYIDPVHKTDIYDFGGFNRVAEKIGKYTSDTYIIFEKTNNSVS